MELNHPCILEFAYIHRTFFHSQDESQLNAAWQTIIFAVPVGHKELPLLHEACKARQRELRELAAKEKAKEKEKAEKDKQLIVKDFSREENTYKYGNFKRS